MLTAPSSEPRTRPSTALSDMGLCPLCQVELELDSDGELIQHTCCHCRDAGRVSSGLARSHPGFGRAVLCPQCVGSAAGPQSGQPSGNPGEFEASRSRVPLSLDDATLNSWLPDVGPVRQVREWANHWPPAKPILLLSGLPGRGKSHLAVGAMKAVWTQHGMRSRFYLVPDLLDRIRATFNDETRHETIDAVLTEIAAVPLLVLDDIGTEKATDWAYEQIFKIVDRRYRDALPLILTTNLTTSTMDARLLSRVQDRKYAVVVEIDGQRFPEHRRMER